MIILKTMMMALLWTKWFLEWSLDVRDRRRLEQFQHVKAIIASLAGKITFKKVKTALTKEGHASPDRYAAMVISILRGNTIDEDVCWH